MSSGSINHNKSLQNVSKLINEIFTDLCNKTEMSLQFRYFVQYMRPLVKKVWTPLHYSQMDEMSWTQPLAKSTKMLQY